MPRGLLAWAHKDFGLGRVPAKPNHARNKLLREQSAPGHPQPALDTLIQLDPRRDQYSIGQQCSFLLWPLVRVDFNPPVVSPSEQLCPGEFLEGNCVFLLNAPLQALRTWSI